MKKLLLYTIGIILVLGVAVYGLLFTTPGNAVVKPILESKLSEASQKSVAIETFTLRSDSLKIGLKIDTTSFLNLSGNFSLFQKSFDVAFDTSLQNIQLGTVAITSKMTLQGTAKGNMENFHLVANGDALQGKINIDANIAKESLKDTVIALTHIEIKELLSLMALPSYAQGIFDLKATLKNVTKNAVDGVMDFKLLPTTFNPAVISKEFNVEVPQDLSAHADIHAMMEGQTITSAINIISSLATFKTEKTIYTLPTQTLNSDYRAEIGDFAKLEPITKMKLKGSAAFDGKVNYSPQGYEASLNSGIFGSDTKVNVINDTLTATVKNLKLDKLMDFLGQPLYTQGEFSLDTKLESIKNLKGTLSQKIDNGKINTTLVNKDFNQTLPQTLTYTMKTEATMADNLIKATSTLGTSLADITLTNLVYHLKELSLATNYTVNIPDLSKLNTIAQRELRGKLALNGQIKQAKDLLLVDGASSVFGGKMDFKLENDNFKASLQNAQLSELLYTLFYPDFFTSTIAAQVDYDLKNAKGKLNATSNDGRFKQNQLGALLIATIGFDITKEIYKNTVFDADINKEAIKFKANMVSQNTQIKTDDGYINQTNKDISSKIDIKIKESLYVAKVSGKTDNPKVKLDTGAVLKGVIEGKTGEKAPVKNILKGLGL